jgi:hypothetical protein
VALWPGSGELGPGEQPERREWSHQVAAREEKAIVVDAGGRCLVDAPKWWYTERVVGKEEEAKEYRTTREERV